MFCVTCISMLMQVSLLCLLSVHLSLCLSVGLSKQLMYSLELSCYHIFICVCRFKDHYRWNKVTTCVHNILGGQRWVDQFGEMTITNGNIVCKLTFTKVRTAYSSCSSPNTKECDDEFTFIEKYLGTGTVMCIAGCKSVSP